MIMLRNPRNASQIIFIGFIVATVTAFADHYLAWGSRIYAGIFGGLVSVLAIWLADKLFKRSED